MKFYGILGNKSVTSKIEALRLAQLQMAGLPDLPGKDKDKHSPVSPNNTRADFRDAYRWGPFIMIGTTGVNTSGPVLQLFNR